MPLTGDLQKIGTEVTVTLSILIVNWNSKEFLRSCLDSINATCAELSPQVVVVDGGSFDGCGELLATEYPAFEFVQAERNLGFGRSNNLGVDRITGDALLLLNPDTVVEPGAVQGLLKHLRELPSAGIVGPKLLNSDGSVQAGSVHPLPTPLASALASDFLRRLLPSSRFGGHASRLTTDYPVRVEAVGGACMMIPTELFRRIGGFTTAYFMYAEDMDLCLKVQRAGLRIYHIPQAQVVHHGGGSSDNEPRESSVFMMHRALHTYMQLNHGTFAAARYRVIICASALLRLAVLASASIVRGSFWHRTRPASVVKWQASLLWSLRMDSCSASREGGSGEPSN